MGWQVQAVQQALVGAGFQPIPPITPVLCFVDGEWPLLFPPEAYEGVRLEGKRSIKKVLAGPQLLEKPAVARVHHALAIAFPAK